MPFKVDAIGLKAENAGEPLDCWRGVIGQQPHLAFYSFGPGTAAYMLAVKRRFVQWVLDTRRRPHDQPWLGYQAEIGRRHTGARKKRTNNTQTPPHIPMRYVRLPVTLVERTAWHRGTGRP
jgi:hypothetical protein